MVVLMLAAAPAARSADYKDVRIKKIPVAVQTWTYHKFTLFEALDKIRDLGAEYVQAYPGQKLGGAYPDVEFGPGLTDAQVAAVREKLIENGLSIYAFGVTGFDNTEESMRIVFDFAKKMGIGIIVTEPAFDDWSLIEKMVREYNIGIAIHNHPDPNKYARPETAYARLKGLDKRIGYCADTGHWMRTAVNPVDAIRILEGRIIDVHLKDLNEFGTKEAHDVPFGQGVANVHDILAELTLQDYHGFLAVEHEWEKELDNPSPSIRKGFDYLKSITYYEGYDQILGWSGEYNKQGWNHYGPGYFELDEETGILKGHKGMGLFWYSVKKYRNFVLELDYMCSDSVTNSGIFLRVPEVPTSNDYIFHSFEIQIDDASTGIHHTGAAYDAEAPRVNAEKPTGQWNHYKIAFVGDRITVELNGTQILDWKAEPRGKIRDFAPEGYIGLQNHDDRAPVYFKNIYIKELN